MDPNNNLPEQTSEAMQMLGKGYSPSNDAWAVVDLLGHVTIAGRITKPGEYGGLWQIDIPEEETFRTEFFGSQSVYRLRMVSEEIARAYAKPNHDIIEYDAPIVTRAEHENAMMRAREALSNAERQNEELRRRLVAVNALPEPSHEEEIEEDQASCDHEWDTDESGKFCIRCGLR